MAKLMQMQSQLLAKPVEKPEQPDVDALLAELEMLRAQLKQNEKKAGEPDA